MRPLLRIVLALLLALSSYPMAAQAAPFSPKQMGPECVTIYRDWLTQPAPKAFALSTNNVDCGASWSHATPDEARADALERCNSTGAPGCAIVNEDTTPAPSVTVGDVTLIGNCAGDYDNFLSQAAPKSYYATANGRSCGAAWGYETLQQSRKEARRLCLDYGEPCQEIDFAE